MKYDGHKLGILLLLLVPATLTLGCPFRERVISDGSGGGGTTGTGGAGASSSASSSRSSSSGMSSSSSGMGGSGGASSSSSTSSSTTSSSSSSSMSSSSTGMAMCGNGIPEPGEECDLGMQNSNTGACTLVCKNATCGDGFVQMGVEQCDDGNQTQGDGCNINCVPSGTPIFTKTFNGPVNGDEVWRGVALDTAGNIHVAGFQTTSVANGVDAVVRKYDPMGNVVWTQTYNGPASLDDAAYGVAVDASGNVIIAGFETQADTHTNVLVQKYNSAGTLVWTQTYTLGVMGFDNVGNGVAVNPMGDIYLAATGQSLAANGVDIIVAKVAGINGSVVWGDIVNGAASGADEAFGIAAAPGGTVLATGYTTTASGVDAWVRKYTDNGISDTIVWTRTFNGLAGGGDFGASIAADPSGNVLVAGVETVTAQGFNVWLQKYDSAGNTVWTQGYNDVANKDDFGLAVACDNNSNVIVAGQETLANNTTNVWVRKYSSAGVIRWTQGYNGAADLADGVNGVAVDANGFIFAAGFETTAVNGADGWLRKYEP